jgi:hypothetical protein
MAAALMAAMAAGEATAAAIDVVRSCTSGRAFLIYHNGEARNPLQHDREFPGPVWNHFKTRLFPLHPERAFTIQ